jgi:subtilisin family serine protease
MIVCECGHAKSADQLREQLAECGAQVAHSFRLIPGVAVGMTPDALKKFFARFPTAKVIPDRRRQIPPRPFGPDDMSEILGPGKLQTSPQNPEVSPLALAVTKADEVHKLGLDGTGVRVCVVDSGIDYSHPDLQGTALMGPDGNPLAADFTETDLTDTVGHGTAVAGSIAAQAREVYTITDENTGKPMAYTRIKGMAPGVKFMTAKVFDTRVASGYDSAIIAALEWAAENGAHIVNMSLGGVTLPNDGQDPLARAVTALRERGILVCVSAGNEGGGYGTLKSPGSSPGALTVGASTMYRSFSEMGFLAEPGKWAADQLASFSSQGPSADGRIKPDILAPGAFDWGLAPLAGAEEGERFQLFGGTSQAAPLMAGAAALIFQAFHKVRGRYPTPDELQRIVSSTADDLGFPAHMMGAGRVNCLRAVQAVQGQTRLVTASLPAPASVMPGKEATVTLDLTNISTESAEVPVSAMRYEPAKALGCAFNGEITQASTPQQFQFDVAPGTDLMQISLDWPTEEHGEKSPRLLVAMYDPKGNFVNYQRPAVTGDIELGKSVDTWIARPEAGRWTARIVLRLGVRDTRQPFTLSMRAFRRMPWNWVTAASKPELLAPGETRQVSVQVRVPAEAIAGTYAGHMVIGSMVIPLAVIVPISLEKGRGLFAGDFQHGYQGSWGNGDWRYHDLPVPAGTRSLVASLQWPDVDNALEFYLIDPSGATAMGRSNAADIEEDGDSDALGSQIVLANPQPGTWRLVLHSFAFCGRGMPEPYSGIVEATGELLSPRTIQVRVEPGGEAPMALYVKNPGRMPLTVQAIAQSTEARLIWQSVEGELKSGVGKDGKPLGDGNATLSAVNVPYGARQVGAIVTWEHKETEISLSIFDPVAQSDRATMSNSQGQVMVMESNPVPGEWQVMAGIVNPGVEQVSVPVKGAVFVVAPATIENFAAETVTVQPGGTAVLPMTVKLPDKAHTMAGTIMVTTDKGDRLGSIGFLIQADEGGEADSEVAATNS